MFIDAFGTRLIVGACSWERLPSGWHSDPACSLCDVPCRECMGDGMHCGELAFEVDDPINNFGDTE